MRRTKRIGLMLWPVPGLDAAFERGIWAEEAGFDDLWFPDAEGMQDPIALAATVGVATTRIRLCTGVVPVFNRPPAVLATGVSVIEQRAPGRFVLGLGSSTSNMIDRWYGLPFEHPLNHVREYVLLLRQIFAGEKTNFMGRSLRSQGFRLQSLPAAPLPIYLGAMGPKMLQLAGEIADGVVLNDFTPFDRFGWALEQVDIGAKRRGRRAEEIEIVKRRAVVVTTDDHQRSNALEFFRRHFAFYASAPVYQAIMLRLGYRDAVDEVRAGYATRDRLRVARAITDDMVSRIFLFGPETHCRTQLREHYAGGIDTIAISPQAETASDFARMAAVFAASAFDPAA